MSIQAVLWDLDGVLVDTGEFHYLSWDATLQANHIPFSRELFLRTFGMNNWGVLTALLGSRPKQEYYDRLTSSKEALFREMIRGRAIPLPGVVETLGLFKQKSLHQGVASSAPMENIDVLVDALALRAYFDAIVSGSQMPGKPAPDVFLAAARALNTPPANCLVIEDAVAGVAGAKNAGMLCLAITNTNPAENLRQADAVLDSLEGLQPAFIEAILSGH